MMNKDKMLQKCYDFVKNEADKAMRNNANRDVVDYYDDFASEIKLVLTNHSKPAEVNDKNIETMIDDFCEERYKYQKVSDDLYKMGYFAGEVNGIHIGIKEGIKISCSLMITVKPREARESEIKHAALKKYPINRLHDDFNQRYYDSNEDRRKIYIDGIENGLLMQVIQQKIKEFCTCKNRQDQHISEDKWICGDCDNEIKQKSRCCGRCNGVNDICVGDQTCKEITGIEPKDGKIAYYNFLEQKIINSLPEEQPSDDYLTNEKYRFQIVDSETGKNISDYEMTGNELHEAIHNYTLQKEQPSGTEG